MKQPASTFRVSTRSAHHRTEYITMTGHYSETHNSSRQHHPLERSQTVTDPQQRRHRRLRADGGGPPIVVKIGGANAVDPAGAVDDTAALVDDGREIVVVHGGSTAVDDTLERMDIEPTYVETPGGVTGRFTDAETMEVFSMVMAGKLNTELTTLCRNAGIDAVGLSGVDGGLLTGPRKSAVRVLEDGTRKIKRGDHSGTIKSVNDDLLTSLLADGYTPVVSVPMLGEDDDEVLPVNADADRSAAAIAGALGADLVLLTDVAGIYADPDDPDTLIESATTPAELDAVADAAEGFMTKKVMAATEALDGSAPAVYIGDANRDAPVSSALDGTGTTIEARAVADNGEITQ